jgi:integrase/recombinase XerC
MNYNLNNYISGWKSWIKDEKRLSLNTIISYEIDLLSFLKFINIHMNTNLNIDQISRISDDDLSAWFFERVKKGISHRSNARALSSLKSFINYLIKKKIINNSKLLLVKGPKFLESLPRPLTDNQISKIINEIKGEKIKWVKMRNLSIVIFMWGYGLRISEVLNLQLKDTNTNELRVLGKGNKIRLIPIAEELIVFINQMVTECPFNLSNNDFIFLGKKGGRLKPEIIQRLIREIRKKIILPDNTTPHSLRHTFATQLLQNFVDLRSIQELLGHSSLSTTQKYTSVTSEHLRKILEKSHPRSE